EVAPDRELGHVRADEPDRALAVLAQRAEERGRPGRAAGGDEDRQRLHERPPTPAAKDLVAATDTAGAAPRREPALTVRASVGASGLTTGRFSPRPAARAGARARRPASRASSRASTRPGRPRSPGASAAAGARRRRRGARRAGSPAASAGSSRSGRRLPTEAPSR